MHDEIVTQIVMVLLETHWLNALFYYTVSIPIRTIQCWGTAREPKDASH